MELLDIYTADRRVTGRVMERSEAVAEGDFLLVVHVCLFNRRGEMLIQKRQRTKDRYGGMWDVSAGGFAASGEDALTAVLREAREEVGAELPAEDVKFLFTAPISYVLDDFFAARYDVPAASFTVQSEEVEEVQWAGREEVLRLLEQGTFVDYDRELLIRCFDMGAK